MMLVDVLIRARIQKLSGLLALSILATGLGFVALGAPSTAAARPLTPDEVPEPLRPWVPWVLYGQEESRCPFLYGQQESLADGCAWPSRLRLELDDRGGRFTQRWRIHVPSSVALVGDDKHWPEEVRVDGQPASVLSQNGRPHLQLEPGLRVITGRFRWQHLPELIQIPAGTGLVALALRGQTIEFTNRDSAGRLWLQKRVETETGESSRVEVVVHRRAIDDTPFLLETRIELRVSGEEREVVLGKALPAGFLPMSLQSPLPARLDPDGRLRAQLRPGSWQISLMARHDGPVNSLSVPTQPPPASQDKTDDERDPNASMLWDLDEVWSFEARPNLRLVDVSGAAPIDPTQTALPSEWHRLPTYLLRPGTTLSLTEKRRGDANPSPDGLDLSRRLWLDFDGGGFTINDNISGVIRRSQRLEMGAGVHLGRAALDGRDQLISRVDGSTLRGIEIPRGPIQLSADSRAEGRDALTAVAWDHDFQSVVGELHLPPGWRLFHASGVDSAVQTWINRWSLLDLFLVLVVSMATVRLFGPPWGVLALVALTLSFPERGAPEWSFVTVLAGIALVRARAEGNFGRAANLFRGLTAASLVLIAIPFCIDQIRVGMHPALEYPEAHGTTIGRSANFDDAEELEGKAHQPRRARPESVAALEVEAITSLSSKRAGDVSRSAAQSPAYGRYNYAPDPNARVTTGPGLPGWNWNRVHLAWSGPVDRSQPLSFMLLSPRVNFFLAFLRVALLALMIGRLLWEIAGRSARALPSQNTTTSTPTSTLTSISTSLLTLATIGLVSLPTPAGADVPSPEILYELQVRLLDQPDCFPECASSPRLWLEVRPEHIDLRLEVHVVASSAIPLPGNSNSWVPARVLVDDRPAEALMRDAQGFLWIQLEPGQHQLSLSGPMPDRASVDLPLPMRPHRTTATTDGWILHGIREDGRVDASLQLTRIREDRKEGRKGEEEGNTGELGTSQLPPFVRITRNLRLGLDWTINTQLIRLTPADVAVVLEVPLLPGESITTEGIQVADGKALVTLAPGIGQRSWTSVLEIQPELILSAPESVAWTESWRLDVSSLWHLEASGIPPIHVSNPQAARIREWRPWPGEEVVLAITRPKGVEGQTLTIDSSLLRIEPGLRSTEARLTLSIRSSRGGQHLMRLPEDALLSDLTIDGRAQPIRQEAREITLPIRPGLQHVVIHWREAHGLSGGFVYRAPEIDLGAPSVNHQVEIAPSSGRWILLAGGPLLGPSVLIWPLLGTMAVLALALGLLGQTPLRGWHWLLLFVGLTQAPILAAAIPVVWLHGLNWRRVNGTASSKTVFNLLQLGLFALTLAALAVLFYSIQQGLLGTPAMQIAGNGSSDTVLRWYQDRIAATPASPWLLSVPMLVYRLAMLAWALWIAQALIGWLRWGWSCFSAQEIWRPIREDRSKPGAYKDG
jgi:hypothetical protein